MKYFLLLLTLIPLPGWCQDDAYQRTRIAQYLGDGAWEAVLSAATTARPNDTFLLQSAGYAAYQTGDKDLSEMYYGRVLALDSNRKQALYYSAMILKNDEQYSEAIPLLEKLCTIAPTVATYRVLLADCYTATNAPRLAVPQLSMANALNPSSAAIANRLATAYIHFKQLDSAEQVLLPALAAHSNDAALLSTGITLAYNQKKWTRTAALADSMIASHRVRYEPMLTALYGDIEGVNWHHAVKLGEVLMALGKETEEVLYSTAFAHQRLNNWKAADTLLRKCVRKVLRPSLEHYYLSLAEATGSMDEWQRASAYYDTAYYLFKNPFTLYQKGISMNNAGHKSEGKAAFEKYLALPERRQDTAIARYMRQVVSKK